MGEENTTSKQPLIRYVNRQQMSWPAVDVQRLIGEDHPARAIWALVGRLDLRRFYAGIESSETEGGRPAFDPQLLISLWVYAYSQGIGSAREVARRCEYDPAFQWLTGLQQVNYHTLADFRVEKQNKLDELFTQVLAALNKETDHTGTSNAGRDEDSGSGKPPKCSARKHHPRALGARPATREGDGRSKGRGKQPAGQASTPTSTAGTARTARPSNGGIGEDAQAEGGKIAEQASQHQRPRSAHHETTPGRTSAQLQRTAFHRRSAWSNRRRERDASGERLGSVATGIGTDRSTAEAEAQADRC